MGKPGRELVAQPWIQANIQLIHRGKYTKVV